MKFQSLLPAALIIAFALIAPMARAENCFRYEGQTLQDAASDAIMNGTLYEHTSNLTCLKELVAKGVDLNKSGNWGSDNTSVAEAAHSGRPDVLEYLLSLGVEISDMSDKNGALNLADIAAVGGSVEVVKMLQARGLPISYKNPKWPQSYQKHSNYFLETCSPILQTAAEWLRTDIVAYLLSQGLNVNGRCGEGFILMSNEGFPTPLLRLAASFEAADNLNGDVSARRMKANATLKVLIDAGADLNAREDINGRTAAHLLLKSKWISPEMIAYVRGRLKQ